MQLYRPRHKTAHRSLQGLFLRLCPLNLRKYQTDTSSYNTACATLERITAPQHLQRIPDTTAAPGRWTDQRSRPIIIRYIRVQGRACYGYMLDGATHRRPCQRGGVSMLPTPGGLQSGTGSADRAGRSGTLHPAGQSSSRGGTAGGAEPLAATAASLFGLSPDNQ